MQGSSFESIKIIFQGRVFTNLVLLLFAWGLAYLAYRNTNPPINIRTKNILRILRMLAFFSLFLSIFDPVIAGIKRYTLKPFIPVLVDNSMSIKVSGIDEPEKKITEFLKGGALENLKNKSDLRIIPFSAGIESLRAEMKFDGEGTAIGGSIAELVSKFEPEEIYALILVSDGQNNIGEDPLEIVEGVSFPIYTIGVGAPGKKKDIFIKDVIADEIAYKDKEFPLKVIVGSYGYEAETREVFLYEGSNRIGSKEIKLTGKGALIDVDFSVKPTVEGEIRYRVYIPEDKEELSPLNNSRNIIVNVRKSKMKFLAVVDILSFDYTFFKRAVLSNPNWEVDEVLVGKEKITNEDKIPRNADDLKKYDCVFVFGSHEALKGRWGYIKEYIQNGGSFLFFALDEIKNPPGELKEILPFEFKPGDGELKSDNFTPEISVDGAYHPITRIDDGSGRAPDRIISTMPPFERFVAFSELKSGGSALLIHPSTKDIPLLTIRKIGQGKEAVITAFPLWKWEFLSSGFKESRNAYRSFVSNVVKWLITKEDEGRFTVSTDKKGYKAGEPIVVKASLKDESGNGISLAYVEARVTGTKTDTTILNEPLADEGGGFYKLVIRSLPADSYTVEVVAKLGNKELGRKKTKFFIEEYSIEFENTGINEPLLREIASLTGGRFLHLANSDSLKDILYVKKITRTSEFEKSIWNSPIFFALFLVCLTTEWFIRKRNDML